MNILTCCISLALSIASFIVITDRMKSVGRMTSSLKTGEEEDLQDDDHVEDGKGGRGRQRQRQPGTPAPLPPPPPFPPPARQGKKELLLRDPTWNRSSGQSIILPPSPQTEPAVPLFASVAAA